MWLEQSCLKNLNSDEFLQNKNSNIRLQTVVKTQANYLSIPRLPQDDVRGILDKWLSLKHRKLTDDQKKIVFSAFTKCPIPLFLKLSFDAASSWTSFAPKSSIVLEATVRDSINSLFQRLETMHGYVFVSRALGYITTGRTTFFT